MNISITLPIRPLPAVNPPSNADKRQASSASVTSSSNSKSQPTFARSLDRARTDPAAPSHSGVFGGGTGGAYGPGNGTAGVKTRVNKPDDRADGSTKQAALPPTGGPDVPADSGPVAAPVDDPVSGPASEPVAVPTDRTAGASDKADTDKHAAHARKPPAANNPGGPGGPGGTPRMTDPQEAAGKGVPGAPLPCMPNETAAELPGAADPSKEAAPARLPPIVEEETPGGPPVECPIDTTGAMTAMLANTRRADDTGVRAKGANSAGDPTAADTIDSKHAGGGLITSPGKNYSTEPVRSVNSESGEGAEGGSNAGDGFGAKLQAVLGTAADAAQATSAATSAAASTTPSAASAAPGATDGALLQGKLPASPGSADFAPQLGAQISTFIRDGVHHARLELNPAEMGPLTVQIKLDGLSASVNLAAQHADTRHALEQAMPELASTLREAGLTLSGGGVSEQPQQTQTGQAGDGGREAGNGRGVDGRSDRRNDGMDTGREEIRTVAAPAIRQRGVVDLVA